MRRVDQLISLIRERTKNQDYTYTASTGITSAGISDRLILEYLNAAQRHLQAAIIAQYPSEFVESVDIPLVGGQEAYTIPDNVFANNKIVDVQYNQHTTNTTDFYPLPPGSLRDRDTRTGTPLFYIRRSGQLLVNPVPSSSVGQIRVQYYRSLDKLDLRRFTINSKTESSGNLLTIVATSTTKSNYTFEVNDTDYVCVSDIEGEVVCYNIPISSYVTDTITVRGTFAIPSGSSISAGDFVTIGKYSTTHSKLHEDCERYLLTYAQRRVMTSDTSETSVEEDAEVKAIEADILQSYANESRDVIYFPVLDNELLNS